MIGILKAIFGEKKDTDQKELLPLVNQINQEFAQLASLSNDQLRALSQDFRKQVADHISALESNIQELNKKGEDVNTAPEEKEAIFAEVDKLTEKRDKAIEEVLEQILPKAFAVMKETARRFKEQDEIEVTSTELDRELAAGTSHIRLEGDKAYWKTTWEARGVAIKWDMVHYDVQLMGGITLHRGKIAEMMTGEGKTLVATLPVYLNALAGKGVHVVTVNDYLAKRDSEWMGVLYQFHGLRVDCIDAHEPNSEERRSAYMADVTFGTNNEFGFDYLRDNMAMNLENLVQRKHHYAIVDEVDSVLIDDARTPLIISGPTPQADNHEFKALKPKVEVLVNAQKKATNAFLTDAKRLLAEAEQRDDKKLRKEGGLALFRAHRGFPKNKALIKFLSEPGIRIILQQTENHYIQDQEKEMPTVDKELFFTIDEKNNSIELTEKGIDLLSQGDDSNLFVMPDLGSEIAAIEATDKPAAEKLEMKDALMRDYTIKAERIHTLNQLLKAYALFEKEVEYVIMDGKVKIVDEQTGRIMEGRRYSDGLHQAIEAKENVKVEASTQTYATITLQNYFRMYHKLAGMTGTAETEAKEFYDIYTLDVVTIPTNKPIARKDIQDQVYRTAREKFNAIIEEVEKLVAAGRPVLVGTTTVENSELLSRMLKLRKIEHQVLNAKYHQQEAEIVARAGQAGTVTIATNMAGRGTDIKLGKGVNDNGGLAILGTERHESRRIDRQLRGRAGRQGDNGSSVFYVSLEDNLMRLFGSERISKWMQRLGMKEGEVISHSMVTRSIERAQRKVEENNFGIRKRLLEYDDVMNTQRTIIYRRRKNALYGDRLELDIESIFGDMAGQIVEEFKATGDLEGFRMELLRVFAIDSPVHDANEFAEIDAQELADRIYDEAWSTYNRHMEKMAVQSLPIVDNVMNREGGQKRFLRIPFQSGGGKGLYVLIDMQEALHTQGKSIRKALQRTATLATIDAEWKEHLREMDDLRDAVRHAQYEQKDPLLIYKLESKELFASMMSTVNKEIISFLMKCQMPVLQESVTAPPVVREAPQPKLQTSRTEVPQYGAPQDSSGQQQQQQEQARQAPVVRDEKKVGRNDKITLYNVVTSEKKEMKFKLAEPLIRSGQWRVLEED
jgi:preprotein translocase subunit SecA